MRVTIQNNDVDVSIEANGVSELEMLKNLLFDVVTREQRSNSSSSYRGAAVSLDMTPTDTPSMGPRRAAQADFIEEAMLELGHPANSREIYNRLVENGRFQSSAKDPGAVVRQVLRADDRFTKTPDGLWTLVHGMPDMLPESKTASFDGIYDQQDDETEEAQSDASYFNATS